MAAASPRREFSPAEQAVAIEAIKRWHNERRSEANVYELDPYDRRISRGMRMALRSLFPPVPETVNREDQAFHTVALDDVKLPVGNYAYVVTRITNRYNASEYVDIFEYRENEWVLLNHYHIAEGLMDSALSDFSWAAYCAENNIDWSPE